MSTPTIAEVLLPSARRMVAYADLVTKDIPADQFARQPEGVSTSSPAFNIGHLATYPDKLFAMIGRPARDVSRYSELFGAGKECRDDPAGTIYPGKDELLALFFERYNALIETLPALAESELASPNPHPNERMRELFPTVGAMLAFMLLSHTFMHLGQISTWRRIMGLGPCM